VIYELPPPLRGTEAQQLQALRDYLVRLAQTLNEQAKHDSGSKEAKN
jgi:hypothetical protein